MLDLGADICSDGSVRGGLGEGLADGYVGTGFEFAAGFDLARPLGRRGEQTYCMATLTGILEWPQRSEGRVRQMSGSTLVQRDDDPFVPQSLAERYKLRNGLEITVTVGIRPPRQQPQQQNRSPQTQPIGPTGGPGVPGSGIRHPPPAAHRAGPGAAGVTGKPATQYIQSGSGPRPATGGWGRGGKPMTGPAPLGPGMVPATKSGQGASQSAAAQPAAAQPTTPPLTPAGAAAPAAAGNGLIPTHEGEIPKPGRGERAVVESIVAIEGIDPEKFANAKPFDELTSIDPQPRLTLEYPECSPSCRLIDLFCPIGRGTRGLIVSPPKAGKTTLLKDIATGILKNHPDVEVCILLVDERPEEVTDFKRSFAEWMGSEGGARPRCRVVGSSNDHDAEVHINVAISTIERCKRMVEAGRHIVVLMDSLTRLGRAFNRSRKYASSGRTLSGGIDSRALEVPKQLFGAARCTEEAGSLTIMASCLVDTGSAMDQVIFEEFKGTGNMELILDRKISERRLFPAINLAASGTRKEHLLQPEMELKTIGALRRRLMNAPPHVQIEQLLAALKRFPTNAGLVGSAG